MSETMQTIVLSAHILVGIMLVSIILIQRGKGSDAGMAFGGGASDTVFGSAGSGNFLTKTTKWLAIAFFCTSLGLAYAYNNRQAPSSILDTLENVQQEGEIVPLASPLPDDLDVLPQLDITSDDTQAIVPEDIDINADTVVSEEPVAEEQTPEGE